jgi:uncharacterized protein YozE (UPF0346 family)
MKQKAKLGQKVKQSLRWVSQEDDFEEVEDYLEEFNLHLKRDKQKIKTQKETTVKKS